jgi:hypothetical protein
MLLALGFSEAGMHGVLPICRSNQACYSKLERLCFRKLCVKNIGSSNVRYMIYLVFCVIYALILIFHKVVSMFIIWHIRGIL